MKARAKKASRPTTAAMMLLFVSTEPDEAVEVLARWAANWAWTPERPRDGGGRGRGHQADQGQGRRRRQADHGCLPKVLHAPPPSLRPNSEVPLQHSLTPHYF